MVDDARYCNNTRNNKQQSDVYWRHIGVFQRISDLAGNRSAVIRQIQKSMLGG
jgi:hypothetical protein